MDNSNSGNETMQNGGNQEVLKLEIFHGKISLKNSNLFFSLSILKMISFF
jgi:hypothetical protein